MSEPKEYLFRLWGDMAVISDDQLKRQVKRIAKSLGVNPSQIKTERMVGDALKNYTTTDLRSKRGGVDGG